MRLLSRKGQCNMNENQEDLRTEEEIDAEIAERKKIKNANRKGGGRHKNPNYLPWNEAREFVQSEMIPSRGKFKEWHARNKPKTIPPFPYRVYKEWISWNDFLGNENKFNEKIGTKWKPLLDATVEVHKLGFNTQTQWMEFARTDQLPADIPARPDLVYDNWRSWNHWLGNKPTQAIEIKQEAQRSHVYFIIRDHNVPLNVLTFGIESSLASMKQRWEREKFEIVKMFWYQPDKVEIVKKIVEALSTPYQGNDRERIVPNVWEVCYYLAMHLDTVTAKDVN